MLCVMLMILTKLRHYKKVLRKTEQFIIRFCLLVIVVNVAVLGIFFLTDHIHIIPIQGGEYTEGLIGVPKHINPLYANMNDVDSDITRLIFSSLLKRNKEGELIKDLALDYNISEDGKNYTFKIRTDVKWHNQENLTADDIIYTFNIIKDAQYKSTLRASFTGVEISKIDDETIKFTLTESYSAFLDLLDFGIIPQDLWYSVQAASAPLAELNLKPIGSGPYKFRSLAKDKLGAIKLYNLTINEDYYGTKPKITNLSFKLFSSTEEAINAINENLIDGISYLPEKAQENFTIQESWNFYKLNLSQLTAVFLNQDNPILKNKSIREALAYSINKYKIVDRLQTQYSLIDGPILNTNFAYNYKNQKYPYDKDKALKILNEYGWQIETIAEQEVVSTSSLDSESIATSTQATTTTEKKEVEHDDIKLKLGAGNWLYKNIEGEKQHLIIELTTVDTEENATVIDSIAEDWEDIGIKTILNKVPANMMQSDIIKPRNFEALFYGQVIGADPDSYAFWHSSQSNAKGLNISNYRNEEVDKLLIEGRLILDTNLRIEKYKRFQEIITQDVPAIFIYSPTYKYVQSKKIKGFDIKNILIPQDRFSNIDEWYIKTGKKFIWPKATN